MYKLLEDLTHRSMWEKPNMLSTRGHLGLCSCQCGPAEDCVMCGTTIRGLNLLNKIDLSKTNER